MYRHLLVPIDATDLSAELVANAVDFAGSVSARITFFYTGPDYAGMPCGDTEARAAIAANGVHAGQVRELLAKAEGAAHANGVPCDSMHGCNEGREGAIVAVAQGRGCDLIFMASHIDGIRTAMAFVSETIDAAAHAGLPVLLFARGAVQPPARAIASIRDEHRSLSAVLHAGMNALAVARARGDVPDAALMDAVVYYLERMRVAQHHPREEDHLFRRLKARTSAFDAEIDELERQHNKDRHLVAVVAGRVRAVSAAVGDDARASAVRALEDAVSEYAAFIWEHLGREEGVILPAARRHLTVADWADIDAAFASDASLRTGGCLEVHSRHPLSHVFDLTRSLDEPMSSS
jgi:nucleotide-binding universal stress UspA family protein/hemerythrin-like domain-containing protein